MAQNSEIHQAQLLRAKMLMQPLFDAAVQLVLQAATPEAIAVHDEGGEYKVHPTGLVTWRDQSQPIQSMPVGNLLVWAEQAAHMVARRGPSADPSGLGL